MRFPPHCGVRRLLVALPLSLTVSCGAVNAANGPEPITPLPPAEAGLGPPAALDPPSKPPTTRPKGADAPERKGKSIDPNAVTAATTLVEPNVTLSALVVDRVAGTVPLAIDIERQFRSASLVKLLIAIDVLSSDADSQDRERLTRMLAHSDDDIASAFWVSGGREDIVRRASEVIGLRGTEPPEDPGRWGEVLLTAADVARVFDHVLRLPAEDRELIVDALGTAPRVAADGFDQHFGIPDGIGSPWAVKQGWGNNETAMVVHSTGLTGPKWRYIVVVLTEHPLDTGWQASTDSATAAARAVRDQLPEI